MSRPERPLIAPSLICADPCHLARDVVGLERIGVDRLHVDVLDGHFSPSMPLGLDAVRALRRHTRLPFDVHLMVTDHDFFVGEMIAIGVERLCFHVETETHPDRQLQRLCDAGIAAGVALKPATPLSVLEWLLDRIDTVLLMLINPGFAGHARESQVPYAVDRVAACRRFLDDHGAGHVAIAVDGRVGFDTVPALVAAGADVLVAGSRSLFHPGGGWAGNLQRMRRLASRGWLERNDD